MICSSSAAFAVMVQNFFMEGLSLTSSNRPNKKSRLDGLVDHPSKVGVSRRPRRNNRGNLGTYPLLRPRPLGPIPTPEPNPEPYLLASFPFDEAVEAPSRGSDATVDSRLYRAAWEELLSRGGAPYDDRFTASGWPSMWRSTLRRHAASAAGCSWKAGASRSYHSSATATRVTKSGFVTWS